MQIIILGAGQVGSSLAENLAGENNDITVIDQDPGRLRILQDRLDIRTAQGNAALPSVLRSAGAVDADMLIAVTANDEINMVACQVAHSLFQTPRKIARIRGHDYLEAKEKIFADKALPVDVLISPEQLVTRHICQLLDHPGALQVIEFGAGEVKLVAIKADPRGRLTGQQVGDLARLMPGVQVRILAIFRHGLPLTPQAHTRIEADDEVFFVAASEHIEAVKDGLKPADYAYRRVIIAGGGNIGAALARALEGRYQVKVIERSAERCDQLTELLDSSVVIHSNASEQALLLEENIEQTDVFCALTNDEEANIMTSLLAKRLGAHTVMALINNPAYIDLIQAGEIDIALSPQQATIGSLLTHIRGGGMASIHALRHGTAEVIEAVARGSRITSRVVGRRVDSLRLPSGTRVGAVIRQPQVMIAHGDLVIQEGDHLILFVTHKQAIPQIEALFQVGFSFF